MAKELRVVGGIQMYVTICKPSRRKAGSSIQKRRYTYHSVGANWLAKDRGQACVKKKNHCVEESQTSS